MKITYAKWSPLWRHIIAVLCIAILLTAYQTGLAGPGAHGPGGEHLDGPAQMVAASGAPRVEASSELFELVARLGGGELSILIDRFETNEPVLGANVEVELGGLKAKATFHADHGDYAVDNAALLKKLSEPGEHALVFSIVAGNDSDLLDGTLKVTANAVNGHGDGHTHITLVAWLAAALIALTLGFVVVRNRRARLREPLAAGGRS